MTLFDPQGPIAAAENQILIDSVVIMAAIVVPTIVAIFAFAFWFRASNARAARLPDWEFSGRIELLVWSIPALTVILLGGVAWIGAHSLDPAEPIASNKKALDIQVVSLDWKWLFIYPDKKIATVNQIVAPVGVPLHFTLTSASVMNAFFIPRLGSMIYTMNGMATQLNLLADKTGELRGQSSHFSGDGFPDMHFPVRIVSPAEFEAWATEAGGAGQTLDEQAYRALTRQSQADPPAIMRLEDPGLFQKIVAQSLPPGEGPGEGRPSASVSPRTGAK